MMAENSIRTDRAGIEQAIERHVYGRTWGRIRHLRVETTDGRIVLRGFTSSYYAKQLAIQALLEVAGMVDGVPVIEIDVVAARL